MAFNIQDGSQGEWRVVMVVSIREWGCVFHFMYLMYYKWG
jgi:hypothetical protein